MKRKKWNKRLLSALLLLSYGLSFGAPAWGAEAEASSVHAVMFHDSVFINGEDVEVTDQNGGLRMCLSYQGSVYTPLYTAGLWLGAETNWDGAHTVTIDMGQTAPVYPDYMGLKGMFEDLERPEGTEQYQREAKFGVDVVLRPDMKVLVDGAERTFVNALGEPVYPLVLRDCVYLPIRGVAELCGMEILYLPYTDAYGNSGANIYLYDRPTPEQNREARAFYEQGLACIDSFEEKLISLAEAGDELGQEGYDALIGEMEADIQRLAALPCPSAPAYRWDAGGVLGNADIILAEGLDFQGPSSYLHPGFAPATWQEARDNYLLYPNDSFQFQRGHIRCRLQLLRQILEYTEDRAGR